MTVLEKLKKALQDFEAEVRHYGGETPDYDAWAEVMFECVMGKEEPKKDE